MSARAAVPDDLPALLALERACFPHDPWTENSLREALGDEKYLVLLWGHEALTMGYILGWNVGDEAEIARIGVLPTLRRQGLGQHLLEAALVAFAAHGVVEVFLEVRAGNMTARHLYDRNGFIQIGSRRHYYANGEDAVVMSRRLMP